MPTTWRIAGRGEGRRRILLVGSPNYYTRPRDLSASTLSTDDFRIIPLSLGVCAPSATPTLPHTATDGYPPSCLPCRRDLWHVRPVLRFAIPRLPSVHYQHPAVALTPAAPSELRQSTCRGVTGKDPARGGAPVSLRRAAGGAVLVCALSTAPPPPPQPRPRSTPPPAGCCSLSPYYPPPPSRSATAPPPRLQTVESLRRCGATRCDCCHPCFDCCPWHRRAAAHGNRS